jgi:enamine deaminase RidA (YjgF/YER057c/UK114 family)
MPIERHNPDELHGTPGYHHVTTVSADKLVFLAGQVPLDRAGALVGAGDVLAQAEQVAANTLLALRSAGLTPSHVVRTVIYVVGDQPVLAAVWRRLHETPLAPAFTTASTLLGVAALGFAGQLVELDVTAAV